MIDFRIRSAAGFLCEHCYHWSETMHFEFAGGPDSLISSATIDEVLCVCLNCKYLMMASAPSPEFARYLSVLDVCDEE